MRAGRFLCGRQHHRHQGAGRSRRRKTYDAKGMMVVPGFQRHAQSRPRRGAAIWRPLPAIPYVVEFVTIAERSIDKIEEAKAKHASRPAPGSRRPHFTTTPRVKDNRSAQRARISTRQPSDHPVADQCCAAAIASVLQQQGVRHGGRHQERRPIRWAAPSKKTPEGRTQRAGSPTMPSACLATRSWDAYETFTVPPSRRAASLAGVEFISKKFVEYGLDQRLP